jgi:hypothetical protein
MTVGRQLVLDAIGTAERLRRYARLLDDFDQPDAQAITAQAVLAARSLEALVLPILTFEGERLPELERLPAAEGER